MVIYCFFSCKIKIYCIFATKYLHICRKICNFVRQIKWTMKRTMKHTSLTIIFIIIGFAYARALPMRTTRATYDAEFPQQEFQSQCIMSSGTRISSTVYEPFSATTPTEDTSGRTYKPKPKTFIGGPESGQGPSPVGEPWILAVFAVVFAGIIAWRNRTLKRDHHGTISRK